MEGLAAEAGAYGAGKVYVADDARLAAPLPQPRVDVLAQVVRAGGFDNVFLAQSILGADIAAGLAARLDAGGQLAAGPTYEETATGSSGPNLSWPTLRSGEVGWTSTPRIALFRAGALDATESGGQATVEQVQPELQDFSLAAEMLEQAHEEATGPSIEDADIIVAGGRGLGGPEGFGPLEELAKALGGAVAATRAVVDAGWYPYSAQVGQTGKTVSPKLYIGAGISGAIQHKVGMQSSNVIVAINKDPNAPIFEFADLAVVGDVNEVVPKLTELVRARKGA